MNDRPNSRSISVLVGYGRVLEHRVDRLARSAARRRPSRRGSSNVPTVSALAAARPCSSSSRYSRWNIRHSVFLRVLEDHLDGELEVDRVDVAGDVDAVAELEAVLVGDLPADGAAGAVALERRPLLGRRDVVHADLLDLDRIDREAGEEVLRLVVLVLALEPRPRRHRLDAVDRLRCAAGGWPAADCVSDTLCRAISRSASDGDDCSAKKNPWYSATSNPSTASDTAVLASVSRLRRRLRRTLRRMSGPSFSIAWEIPPHVHRPMAGKILGREASMLEDPPATVKQVTRMLSLEQTSRAIRRSRVDQDRETAIHHPLHVERHFLHVHICVHPRDLS